MIQDHVLFVGDTSLWSTKASQYASDHFGDVRSILWDYGEPYPSVIDARRSDIILSFKSDLILTNDLLSQAQYAINFHPSPPRYRGIGGYEYAVMNNDQQFGVTCHHMVEKIDFGTIIKVINFPIPSNSTASTIKEITAAYCLTLFCEIVDLLAQQASLPVSKETWGDRLYTRAELDRLNFVDARGLQ